MQFVQKYAINDAVKNACDPRGTTHTYKAYQVECPLDTFREGATLGKLK